MKCRISKINRVEGTSAAEIVSYNKRESNITAPRNVKDLLTPAFYSRLPVMNSLTVWWYTLEGGRAVIFLSYS